MTRMLFYDTKSYDKLYFDQLKKAFDVDITYVSVELNEQTVTMANGSAGARRQGERLQAQQAGREGLARRTPLSLRLYGA